jgi:hypothetical protein
VFDDLAALFHEHALSAYHTYVNIRDEETPTGRSRHVRAALDAATALFHFASTCRHLWQKPGHKR